jgi:hypothetical protein
LIKDLGVAMSDDKLRELESRLEALEKLILSKKQMPSHDSDEAALLSVAKSAFKYVKEYHHSSNDSRGIFIRGSIIDEFRGLPPHLFEQINR